MTEEEKEALCYILVCLCDDIESLEGEISLNSESYLGQTNRCYHLKEQIREFRKMGKNNG